MAIRNRGLALLEIKKGKKKTNKKNVTEKGNAKKKKTAKKKK